MLNVRQEKFCLEYAKCGNATESAKKAGYSERTAKSIGQRLLTYVDIKDRLQELAKIAEDAKIADIKEMQQKLTSIIRQETTEEVPMVVNMGEWSDVQVVNKKPSINNIISAIEKLGKMQGAFTDKVQVDMLPVIIKGEMPDDY
jgi:phage terminase small subunit